MKPLHDDNRSSRLSAVPPLCLCHLCPDETQSLAAAAPTVSVRVPAGPLRQVFLCAFCHTVRPGRAFTRLGPADLAWRALERDATDLLTAYQQGFWAPRLPELEFAGAVARMPWSQDSMRTALLEADNLVYAGRLARALDNNAVVVLQYVPADDPAFHSLRRLIGVLAAAAERPPGARPDGAT